MVRVISLARQRRLAARMVATVVVMQAALLAVMALTPGEPPSSGTLWQLLWAAARQPIFYPLVALLLVGVPLTVVALRVRGKHLGWLVAAWAVFLVIGGVFFGDRLVVMLRVLWWQYGT